MRVLMRVKEDAEGLGPGHQPHGSGVANPKGLAEGSRWSFGGKGERPPEAGVGKVEHPSGVPEPRDRSHHQTAVRFLSKSLMLQRTGLAPRWGARLLLRRCPEVAAPNPAATSGYLLATLRVD